MKSGDELWVDRIVIGILVVSFGGWLIGLAGSPLFYSGQADALVSVERPDDSDPAERALARAYWNRYPDVANHSYFGENGVLGSDGARTHYLLHGKAEGRRWGPASSDEPGDGNAHRAPTDRCSAEETARPNR